MSPGLCELGSGSSGPWDKQKRDRGGAGTCRFLWDSYQSQGNATSVLLTLHLWGFYAFQGFPVLCEGLQNQAWSFRPSSFLPFSPKMVSPPWMSHSWGCQAGKRGAELQEGDAREGAGQALSQVCPGSPPLPRGTQGIPFHHHPGCSSIATWVSSNLPSACSGQAWARGWCLCHPDSCLSWTCPSVLLVFALSTKWNSVLKTRRKR